MQLMTEQTQGFLVSALELMAALFIFVVGCVALWVVIAFVVDVTQTKQAVRRNYPVIGRFRYLFEHLGEFFRQYFFAMDREELPFNRAQRSWVYRAAKDLDNTVAFGSTRNISVPGQVLFVNCPYPDPGHGRGAATAAHHRARTPGTPIPRPRLFNISGMSYGAISRPAVQALSAGAAKAGCWINTGEGGLSPYHLESGADLIVSDRNREERRARPGRQPERRQAARGGRASTGQDVRDQAQPGGEAGQGRHPAWGQGHPEIAAIRGIRVRRGRHQPEPPPGYRQQRGAAGHDRPRSRSHRASRWVSRR